MVLDIAGLEGRRGRADHRDRASGMNGGPFVTLGRSQSAMRAFGVGVMTRIHMQGHTSQKSLSLRAPGQELRVGSKWPQLWREAGGSHRKTRLSPLTGSALPYFKRQ